MADLTNGPTTKEEIFEEVRSILCRNFEFKPEEVLSTSHLIDDLDLDSIDAIDLAVKLEERTGLELEEKELRSLRLVQDVVDVVYANTATRLPAPAEVAG